MAQERARAAGGTLILRNEDLDTARCRAEFSLALLEDLHWMGLRWQEGPDCGGAFGPYSQSERGAFYVSALEKLYRGRYIYPCTCSRQDVQRAVQAPHPGDDEPVYPGTCRERDLADFPFEIAMPALAAPRDGKSPSPKVNWRFRVPDGESIAFVDAACGRQDFVAGTDLGDFVVWRHDRVPAYQLAVVVDDAAMEITEVVRGADLLASTARQLLLYRALNLEPPLFCHCPLMTDEFGVRLAKRHDGLSLRRLREQGALPAVLCQAWAIPGAANLRCG